MESRLRVRIHSQVYGMATMYIEGRQVEAVYVAPQQVITTARLPPELDHLLIKHFAGMAYLKQRDGKSQLPYASDWEAQLPQDTLLRVSPRHNREFWSERARRALVKQDQQAFRQFMRHRREKQLLDAW